MKRHKKKLPNGARSIMASRKEPKASVDAFWTPPWATRSLCQVVLPHLDIGQLYRLTAWEPACGEGLMSKVLNVYFHKVRASDIHDYGQRLVADFLSSDLAYSPYDWIITNPPFRPALDFTLRALDLAREGVAMFVRSQWAVEGCERYEKLFRDRPPTLMAFFSERVNLCRGRWDPDGTTATAYCWLVWVKGREPMPPFWIPPGQRKALTRADDRARFAAWSLPKALEAAE
jgi:hypothetical protein